MAKLPVSHAAYICTNKVYFYKDPAAMLFSSSKIGHISQILATGAVWEFGTTAFTPPTAGEIETFVHVVIQVVVGIVTVVATIRKMFQKPETVVKLPAVGAVAMPATPATEPVAPVTPLGDPTRAAE